MMTSCHVPLRMCACLPPRVSVLGSLTVRRSLIISFRERTRLSFLASPRPASSPGGCAPRVAAWRRPHHPASPRGVLPIRPAHHTGAHSIRSVKRTPRTSTSNGIGNQRIRCCYLEFNLSKKRDAIVFVMPTSSESRSLPRFVPRRLQATTRVGSGRFDPSLFVASFPLDPLTGGRSSLKRERSAAPRAFQDDKS